MCISNTSNLSNSVISNGVVKVPKFPSSYFISDSIRADVVKVPEASK